MVEPEKKRVIDESRPFRRTATAIVAAHIVAGIFLLAPGYLRPDSVAIYSYLRSLVFDHDQLFFNEWGGFGLIRDGVTMFKEVTPVGALANHWWIGTSILSAPAYLAAHLTAKLTGGAANGFSGIYALALAWSTVAFGAIASLYALSLTRGENRMERRYGVVALLLVWIGSPLIFYEFRFPLGTHLAGALTVAAALFYLLRSADTADRTTAFLAGLWFGLAVATRLQHVMLAPAVLLFLVLHRRPKLIVPVAAGSILPVAVQAAAWFAVYGHPLGPLASGASHAGTTWMPFTRNALGTVLFSSYHGLLSWSPVLLLAIIGWFIALRDLRRRPEAMLYLTMFAGEWIANGLFDRYFWGGLSFGGRRFIDLALPFVVGLFWCIRRWPRLSIVAGSFAAAWNLALAAAAAVGRLDLANDVSPLDMITAIRGVTPSSMFEVISAGLRPATAGLTFAGLAIAFVVMAAIGVSFVAARRQAWVLAIYVIACTALILSSLPRTRRTASEWQRLTGVDVRASAALGPLLDERTLLTDEWQFLRTRGEFAEAQRTENDLAAVQERIGRLSR